MISHFSQEPFEGTFHIEDADLQKMVKVLNDVNVKECPYFDLSDKYGNSARYYRENQWIPCSERLPEVGEYVLCSQDNGDVGEGKLLDYGSWFICYDQTCRGDYWVKAWAPLPDQYKGEE